VLRPERAVIEMHQGVTADGKAEREVAAAETITIRINPLRGKIFSIDGISKTTTLSEVKAEIYHLKHIDVAEQRLIFKGKQPDGNWTMADLGIVHGTELRLVAEPTRRAAAAGAATSHRDKSRRK
jgi:hypothetical protein